ncbi:Phenylacrylic acid decarboxylase [Aspergillus sclerotiicarbonarius CBS 121057]|uniref:Flavin prenyltransferase PAD1, mitochondrial n=1 Tax=Aspergillus sclerotiicarbonarius (strain CBS 121057 / IBT 28362) TaxID=1448318 RepID=A0A319DRA3_ASPSB|nr:Phenylacrylic acid decarboxylase [Aspergillus sclerotiicarbonarius CBS 121057]
MHTYRQRERGRETDRMPPRPSLRSLLQHTLPHPRLYTTTPPPAPPAPPKQPNLRHNRLILALTGATGSIYGIQTLQTLHHLGITTHLILSKWALSTLTYETPYTLPQLTSLATHTHNPRDLSAPPSSGSFQHDGMIIAPCSMKTLAAIRMGYGEDLISRAADVCIKEGRKLVLMVRETPLSPIHLENMLLLARLGVVVFPPVPGFYFRRGGPRGLEEVVGHSVGRMLDCLGVEVEGDGDGGVGELMRGEGRWEGFRR